MPTTGLYAILMAIHRCARVDIYGFHAVGSAFKALLGGVTSPSPHTCVTVSPLLLFDATYREKAAKAWWTSSLTLMVLCVSAISLL
jgi:hypothetical protein